MVETWCWVCRSRVCQAILLVIRKVSAIPLGWMVVACWVPLILKAVLYWETEKLPYFWPSFEVQSSFDWGVSCLLSGSDNFF